MALLRGEQIGVIDKQYIYDVISAPKNVKWVIKAVQMEMRKLLGLDQIKIMCHNNTELYELAVEKRINGNSFDEVCDFVQYHLIIAKINKE